LERPGQDALELGVESGVAPYIACGTSLTFRSGGSTSADERARIDSSGRLLVGTSSSYQQLDASIFNPQIQSSGSVPDIAIHRNVNDEYEGKLFLSKARGTTYQAVTNGDILGSILFTGANGTRTVEAAKISAVVDGTVSGGGAADMPGRLVFSTTADGASSPTERMRIRNDGKVLIGTTTVGFGSQNGFTIEPDSASYITASHPNGAASGSDYLVFGYNGSKIGSITQNGTTGVAYNTSSDYRLKENIAPLVGAIDRLIQIPVHRFNFISEPGKTVDGFLAHEAQAVVPECVTGEKDAVDDDGNPVYQGIDQSKLVPLLTAALQEALQKIEDLEGRLTAAGL
jgi:hypothetical protein